MSKTKKIKKQKTFYMILGKISDILVYPIMVIAFLSSFFMFSAKSKNQVPPVFGLSLVRILSGSMIKSGFEIGDLVFVKQADTETLQVGDVIAFYYYRDSADPTDFTPIKDIENPESIPKNPNPDWVTKNEVAKKGIDVYFHQITNIYMDTATGARFFQTKGTSNSGYDSFKTRDSYVVGKYVNTPVFVRNIFKFCSTPIGMLLLVVFPLSILVLMQMLSVLEQLNNLLLEKKVIALKIRIDTEESIKANIGIEMRDFDKAYLYDIVPEEEKENLYKYIFGYMENIELNKKRKIVYETAQKSIKVYNFKDSANYWEIWISEQKTKYLKNQFIKARQQAVVTKINPPLMPKPGDETDKKVDTFVKANIKKPDKLKQEKSQKNTNNKLKTEINEILNYNKNSKKINKKDK